jgi:hypothetical protein
MQEESYVSLYNNSAEKPERKVPVGRPVYGHQAKRF